MAKIPFEHFRIRHTLLGPWGTYVIKTWPLGPGGDGWGAENRARNDEIQEFIRNAISEKMEREETASSPKGGKVG